MVVVADLQTDADDATLAKLAELTERYCVVGQSLAQPPRLPSANLGHREQRSRIDCVSIKTTSATVASPSAAHRFTHVGVSQKSASEVQITPAQYRGTRGSRSGGNSMSQLAAARCIDGHSTPSQDTRALEMWALSKVGPTRRARPLPAGA